MSGWVATVATCPTCAADPIGRKLTMTASMPTAAKRNPDTDTRHVPDQLDRLHAALSNLGEVARLVEDQLGPVLRPEPPTPGPMAVPSDPDYDDRSTVARGVADATASVQAVVRQLERLAGRIDV